MLHKHQLKVIVILNNFIKIEGYFTKPDLIFTPKSVKLQPCYYKFDIFIKAAELIQRNYRGYLSRKSNINFY